MPFAFSASLNSRGIISSSNTSIPMFAKWQAIPDPIIPDPITATFFMCLFIVLIFLIVLKKWLYLKLIG